jgi:hypothetical protein
MLATWPQAVIGPVRQLVAAAVYSIRRVRPAGYSWMIRSPSARVAARPLAMARSVSRASTTMFESPPRRPPHSYPRIGAQVR